MKSHKIIFCVVGFIFQLFLLDCVVHGQTNANLIINGDFEKGEKGCPSNWAFQGDMYISDAEYNEKYSYEMKGGMAGERCMLLKCSSSLVYMRQVIQTPVSKKDKYKISAYVKTENLSGNLRLSVIPGKGWTKSWGGITVVKPTQDWTLMEQTFTPTEDDDGLGVVILTRFNEGKAWIDGVKLELVEKGKEASNSKVVIEEQKGIKINRFVPLGEQGLFWKEEPLQFQISGANNTAEQQEFEVSFVANDFYGVLVKESKKTFTVPPKADFSQTIDLGKMDKYGFFCVRASLKQNETLVDQKAVGCCVLLPPNAEKDSFLSANSGARDKYMVSAMQRIGVNSKGINFNLAKLTEEQRENIASFLSLPSKPWTESQRKTFMESDMDLMGTIYTGGDVEKGWPEWYRDEIKARRARGEFPYPDAYFNEFGDFIEAAAAATHDRIKTWMITEEYETASYRATDRKYYEDNIARYIRQVKIANERLKKVDPDCTVIALAAATSEVRPPCWRIAREKLLPALKGHFDMFGPDAYNDLWQYSKDNIDKVGCEKQGFRDLLLDTAELQKSLGSKTDRFAICEKGWAIPYHYEPDDEVARKAAFNAARYLIIAKSVPQLSFVSLWCISSEIMPDKQKPKSDDANPIHDYGFWKMIYTNPTNNCFYPRSIVAAVSTFNRLLANVTDPVEINVRKGFYAYVFRKKDQAIAALWTIDKEPYRIALDLPAAFEYWDLMGNMKTLPKGRTELMVSDCPFFLVAKTSAKDMSNLVSKADFLNQSLVNAELHVSDLSMLTVYLRNMVDRPVKAMVKLDPPASVKMPVLQKEVEIPAGGRNDVSFEMNDADIARLNGSKITAKVMVENQEIPISENIDLIPIREMKSPVTIDGDLSKYAKVEPIILGKMNFMISTEYAEGHIDAWKNDDNLSAKFYLAWDTNNFYIAAEVTDDVHLQRQTGDHIWKDDCVQFAFDAGNDSMESDYTFEGGLNDNDYNYGMALTKEGPVCWCWMEKGKLPGKFDGTRKFPLAIKREGTKTIYELAIPWKNLAPLEPKPGKVFRFNFLVFDNDSENQPYAKYWRELTRGIAGGADPSAFKMFVLSP